jgi:phenylacetate-CoA ligase
MIDNNISPLSNLQAVLCGSENLYPWQRSFLEKAFQCRIYSWYGHSEKAVLAGECEQSNYYHNFDEYGIVELLSPDGLLIRGEGESGKIVATSLNNFAMPFIRYKTEDIAERCDSACRCGRHYSLIKKVEGRSQDIIVTSDNRLITLTALIFAQHFDAFCNIKGMQLYQDTKGELVVRIIKAPSYSDTDEMEIRTKMAHAAIRGLSISFHYVDVVERTNIGKTKFLIQKISSIPDGSR